MEKKRVWKSGCCIGIFLMVCTLLSYKVESLMALPVRTTGGTIQSGDQGEEIVLPQKAVTKREEANVIQMTEKVTGKFGDTELRVKEYWVNDISEEEEWISFGMWELPQSGSDGRDIICDWIYPLREGETVVQEQDMTMELYENGIPDLEAHRQFLRQMYVFAAGIGFLPAAFLYLRCTVRKLWDCKRTVFLTGVLMLVLFMELLCLYLLVLEIPRQLLPRDQIFDFGFYSRKIGRFLTELNGVWKTEALYSGLRTIYLNALKIYGGIIVCELGMSAVCWRKLSAPGRRRV
ncbi:MAG: hypothetical protein HFG94_09120 [Dorea sp.]|jgi:hypothetical protein|nr:hypothetical protein [Dorea sp.]MCI9614690.1 hypothetical protein [Dorea sp.]